MLTLWHPTRRLSRRSRPFGDLFDEMIQYRLVKGDFEAKITKLEGYERPPMVTIPEYLEKIRITA